MATIYKRTRQRPIPPNAEIVERGSERFAIWMNRRTMRKQRASLTADGKKVIIEASGYEIEYRDHNGKRQRRSTRCTDRDAVEQMARELERGVLLRKEGIIDPAADRYSAEARRPIAVHLDEFKASIVARANTAQHCRETHTKAARIVELCSVAFVQDLTASSVQAAIKSLKDGGRSLKTCNHYLRAIKSFTRWLQRDKRTREDALATLRSFNAATDPKHVRRELTEEEIARLIGTTEGRTRPEHNMPGADRAIIYRLALGTGFRASELRSLTPSSFHLDDEPPTVTVHAAHSKRRRTDAQPIRRDLAETLGCWLEGKPEGTLFAKLPRDTARMLRRDLKAARAAWIAEATTQVEKELRTKSDFLVYENAAGEVADFHSFRHAYISSIVNGGASVKVAQELARHSTPTLTIGRYTHTRLHDLQGALDALPTTNTTFDNESERQVLRASGTDAATPRPPTVTTYDVSSGGYRGGYSGGEPRQKPANDGQPSQQADTNAVEANLLAINALDGQGQSLASVGETTPTGIRTPVDGLRTRCPRPLDDRGV